MKAKLLLFLLLTFAPIYTAFAWPLEFERLLNEYLTTYDTSEEAIDALYVNENRNQLVLSDIDYAISFLQAQGDALEVIRQELKQLLSIKILHSDNFKREAYENKFAFTKERLKRLSQTKFNDDPVFSSGTCDVYESYSSIYYVDFCNGMSCSRSFEVTVAHIDSIISTIVDIDSLYDIDIVTVGTAMKRIAMLSVQGDYECATLDATRSKLSESGAIFNDETYRLIGRSTCELSNRNQSCEYLGGLGVNVK